MINLTPWLTSQLRPQFVNWQFVNWKFSNWKFANWKLIDWQLTAPPQKGPHSSQSLRPQRQQGGRISRFSPLLAIALLTSLLCDLGGPATAAPPGDALRQEISQFQQVFNKRRPRPEGARRGGLCALSPGTDVLQTHYVIWSDRPLFLWQADAQIVVQRLRVFQADTEEMVWEQPLTPTQQQVLYDGQPLQPGKVYSWELQFSRKASLARQATPLGPAAPVAISGSTAVAPPIEDLKYHFQRMNAVKSSQISASLAALKARLTTAGTPPDIIALQQAQYLADQELLSDALQVLYAVEQPSEAIASMLQTLSQNLCNPMLSQP